jgi:Flp pilus assembly pilin Flp
VNALSRHQLIAASAVIVAFIAMLLIAVLSDYRIMVGKDNYFIFEKNNQPMNIKRSPE